jgi:hypothetical protein
MAPNPVGNPQPFSTPSSASHGNHGHSKTSGLSGTRQKFDDGSTVTEATEQLSAVRDNELDSSLTAKWRQHEKGNVIDVQQTNYSYKNRVLPAVTLFTNLTDIPADVPSGFTATAVKAVIASQFGKNDHQDEGTGSTTMGIVQTNSEVFGASVKVSVMKTVFGADWKSNPKRLGALADVYFPDKKRMVRVPLVDIGPGEGIPAEVDLTWASDQFLGTQGQAHVKYRLLLPA